MNTRALAKHLVNLMTPPTDEDIEQVIAERGLVENDDTRRMLKESHLQLTHKDGVAGSRFHVCYDATETLGMLEAITDNQSSETVSVAAARAAVVWDVLADVGSNDIPLGDVVARLNQELESSPIDALTVVALCLLARDTARQQRELLVVLPGVKGSDKRYDQKNGFRDKKNKLLEIWKSGKYKSKAACASAEYVKHGVSLETARKWLRGA